MWVQPNVYLAAHFLLSPLGLQHTFLFKNETEEPQQLFFFFGAVFPVRCEAARVLAGVGVFLGAENRRAGCYFSRSRKSAAAIFFCCSRTARFVCRLGEIFINLFFDLRLDLLINFIHYI